MRTIREACQFRPEVEEEELFEVVHIDNVHRPHTREASAEFVFRITYPTDTLWQVLDAVSQKLRGEREKGTFIVRGSYGTGKSHVLLVLYHALSSPDLAKRWAASWHRDLSLPDRCRAIVVNALTEDPRALWDPVFHRAGLPELADAVRDHPDANQVRRLVADGPTVIIFDELVPWYQGLDEARKARTRNFLQVLSEVADDPTMPLAVVVSILHEQPDLCAVLYRHQPYQQDLTTQPQEERVKIIRFRLLEDWDETAAELTAAIFEDLYHQREELERAASHFDGSISAAIRQCYPFHPQLLKCIFDAYETVPTAQNTRGALYLLRSVLRAKADETPLILAGHLDPTVPEIEKDLLQMNPKLVERCKEDLQRCSDLPYADRVLATILLHSFFPEERGGASATDILIGSALPGDNFNEIESTLEEVTRDRAWFVHEDGQRYKFKPEENLPVAIISEARRKLQRKDASQVVFQQLERWIRQSLEPGAGAAGWQQVVVVPTDEREWEAWRERNKLWQRAGLKLLVSLRPLSGEEIYALTEGGTYRNTAIWLMPKGKNVLENNDVRLRAMSVAVCDELIEQAQKQKDSEKVRRLREEKQRQIEELHKLIQKDFGIWAKLQAPEPGTGAIPVQEVDIAGLDKDALWEMIAKAYPWDRLRDWFRERIHRAGERGITFGELLEQCLRTPGYPLLINPRFPVLAVKDLLSGGDGEREPEVVAAVGSRQLDAEEFERATPDERSNIRLVSTEFVPARPPVTVDIGEGTDTATEGGSPIIDVVLPPQPVVEVRTEKLEASSPALLQDQLERQAGAKGVRKIRSFEITIKGGSISLQQLMSAVGNLPEHLPGKTSYELKLDYEVEESADGDGREN